MAATNLAAIAAFQSGRGIRAEIAEKRAGHLEVILNQIDFVDTFPLFRRRRLSSTCKLDILPGRAV